MRKVLNLSNLFSRIRSRFSELSVQRQAIILGLTIFAILAMTWTFWPPSARAVDLVNGITPVSEAMNGIRPTLQELAALSPEQRTARLKQNWPNIEQDVVYFLRRADKLQGSEVERVEFFFGSLKKARAEDKVGTIHDGYFSDQLLAKVTICGRNEPLTVIVQCLNGTFLFPEDYGKLQNLGSFVPRERFVIGPRQGLATYVDYPVAMDLAERFNLPLYRGRKIDPRNRITVAEARGMETNVNRVQVTVFVVEGDAFDLAAGTFTPSPRRKSSK